MLHTPYSLDELNRPAVVSVNGSTGIPSLRYNTNFTIVWTGPGTNVTGVALVAPSTDTHGFNNNQRVVFCRVLARDDTTRQLVVRTPIRRAVAPPQSYLIFLLNRKTYSRGRWVRLN